MVGMKKELIEKIGFTILCVFIIFCTLMIYVFPSSSSVPENLGDNGYVLQEGWNMVSMPLTINKTEVFVVYNGSQYTWNEAVNESIIGTWLYTYNNSGYVESTVFELKRGYWLWSYVTPVYLTETPTVVYCGKLIIDSNYTYVLNCSKLVISPELYNNTIYCKEVNVGEIIFRFEGWQYKP